MPHLTILSGPTRGQSVPIVTDPFRIGRDPSVEHPITDSRASRVHLEIVCKNNEYTLRDLKSKNGTLVNGNAVTSHNLTEGDQIQIGETRFAFSLQEASKRPAVTGPRHSDSVVINQLPLGVAPAMGTAGMARGGAETFETIELSAPLAILRGQEEAGETPHGGRAPALDDSSRRAVKSLRALYGIAKAAAESKTSTDLWRALSGCLLSALEADRVTPVLIDGKSKWHVAEAAGGSPEVGRTKFTPTRKPRSQKFPSRAPSSTTRCAHAAPY